MEKKRICFATEIGLDRESAIMIVLLNPKELLLSLSQEIEHGKILKLIVRGFEPVFVKVGKEGVQVLENGQQEFTIRTDSETFIRLLFGKTSFLKEVLRRKVVTQLRRMPDTIHFFELIKAKEWYIPSGDWC